jgi:hypothetical protein
MRLMKVSVMLVIGAVLSACGATSPLIGDENAPISDRPVSFENVVLADDMRSVRVDFVGGKEFDPEDPCSVAYRGTAEVVGEELEIGIYAQQHPKPLPPDTGCAAMGYSRTLTLDLDDPFTGMVVRDLAGQVFMLAPPAGLAQIGALPAGWELRREGNVLGSSTPRWERVWSPDPDPWPAEGDSMLSLYQAFGGPVNTTGGDPQPPVEVNGESATFYLHPPTGEMVVVWGLGDDELALVGNLNDFSQDEFIALAESVTVPSD